LHSELVSLAIIRVVMTRWICEFILHSCMETFWSMPCQHFCILCIIDLICPLPRTLCSAQPV